MLLVVIITQVHCSNKLGLSIWWTTLFYSKCSFSITAIYYAFINVMHSNSKVQRHWHIYSFIEVSFFLGRGLKLLFIWGIGKYSKVIFSQGFFTMKKICVNTYYWKAPTFPMKNVMVAYGSFTPNFTEMKDKQATELNTKKAFA